MELPPAWSWKLPMDQHTGKYFPQKQQQQQQLLLQPERSFDREHLFEKPLTPSDVGKLNRLVIPKQHAEKYFPLYGDSGEKCLLLSFEDESGKAWRFRYSYWASSQSYVLTKGWTRFVKEKRLDAGDVVFFERRRRPPPNGDLLYIGWKRRGVQDNSAVAHSGNAAEPWSPTVVFYDAAAAPQLYPPNPTGEQAGLVRNTTTKAPPPPPVTAVAAAATNSKRLRLFGVNLDYVPNQQRPELGSNSRFG